ncbi:MAG: alginate export family protein [Pseudomonadota bacterium]
MSKCPAFGVSLNLLLLLWVCPAAHAASSRCEAAIAPGGHAPTAADPYPLEAAGWGPELGNGLMASRWAEDWSGMRAAGEARPFKAIPLGGEASLTLGAEARLRYDAFDNGQLSRGNHDRQGLLRAVLGADVRLTSNVRLYGEVGSGQVDGRRDSAGANFQNDASLQQLFVDARGYAGETLVGAMLGRQEFAEGPRQLISLSDGPNLHRSWNGVRLYAHGQRARVGAYQLRATALAPGAFDERVNAGERLGGLNASLILSSGAGPNAYLEPFWIHSEKPGFRSGGHLGLDERDTLGVRLWGRRGALKFDWTLAQQSGHWGNRDIQAWGLFSLYSLALSSQGWKPRLTAHIDLASGGAYGRGTHNGFNPLYASSNYLGEGGFLSLSNLLLIAPGMAVSPTATTQLAIEYGFARRLDDKDAVYAGGMRAYAGTQQVTGHRIGDLTRIAGSWNLSQQLSLLFNYEHLAAGDVLQGAGLPSGRYATVGATYRY